MADAPIRVTVAYSPAPRQVLQWLLELPAGATVQQAVAGSGLAAAYPGVDLAACDVGIWGRPCRQDALLHAGDRVEVYRGLQVDPKVARRERFRQQGARAAGLFARKRPGAKPGY